MQHNQIHEKEDENTPLLPIIRSKNSILKEVIIDQESHTLENLSTDTTLYIMKFLSLEDVSQLSLVSKELNSKAKKCKPFSDGINLYRKANRLSSCSNFFGSEDLLKGAATVGGIGTAFLTIFLTNIPTWANFLCLLGGGAASVIGTLAASGSCFASAENAKDEIEEIKDNWPSNICKR